MTSTPQPITEPGTDALADKARDHLWMAIHPPLRTTTTARATSRSSSAARAPTSGTTRASATSTACPGCSPARSATAARSSPRRSPSRPRSSSSSRCGPTRTRRRSSWPSASPATRPGDLNRVFFTTGGGEAVETRLEAGQAVLQAHRQAHASTRSSAAASPTTAPRRARWPSPACRPSRTPFEPLMPGAHQGARTPTSTGRPRSSRHDEKAFGLLGGRPHRRGHRVRGPRHRRRGVPRARAERRRLLPAAARILRAGPRDLRRVRRAAGLRRDHLRVRPHRRHVRHEPASAYARHHHLRQGHDLGLRPDGRDDRQRPAVRAVQARHATPSCTATPSAGTRWPRRPHWRTSTSSSARASTTTSRQRAALPPDAGEAHDLPIVGDVRGAGFFYGIELVKDKETKETFNDDECERLLRGFLSKALFDAGPVLPRRRPRRPGHSVGPAADQRPAGVRRDRADPALGADGGLVPAVTEGPRRSRVHRTDPGSSSSGPGHHRPRHPA